MVSKMIRNQIWLSVALCLAWLLVGCGGDNPPADNTETTQPTTAALAESGTSAVEVAPTPVPTEAATATPQLAALVNQNPIPLSAFTAELGRYQQAQANLGLPLEADYEERVFLDLIEQEILRQAAVAQGLTVSPEMVTARVQELIDQAGGTENFNAWLEANQTTAEDFNLFISKEMLAAAVLDQVTAEVPYEATHWRASYLEVADLALAQSIATDLSNGGDFATAAQTHSLDRATGVNGGDLGYFTTGSLLVPELEAAAQALAQGETSDIISVTQSDGRVSHYIITLTEAGSQRPLTEGQRAQLLRQIFENWLAEQLASAEIIRYID